MTTPFEDRSKGEQKFIEQMTRKKLVEWCDKIISKPFDTPDGFLWLDPQDPYVQYALQKKWISNRKGEAGWFRVLATGWTTAASFLKR